jgi:DNA topoisomerase-1
VLAAKLLCDREPSTSAAAGRKAVASAIDEVARRLGNTRAVCRKCYVHPAVIEAYLDGTITRAMGTPTKPEAAILRLLRRRSRATARSA